MVRSLYGYYINLDKRTDRLQHFESNVKNHTLFNNIERIKAIQHKDGALGCAYSHLLSLQTAKRNYGHLEYIAVFEDDFTVLNEDNYTSFTEAFDKIKSSNEWDIIVLTPRGIPKIVSQNILTQNKFNVITDAQTMTGYIIKMSYVDVLMQNLKNSIYNQFSGGDKNIYACDQYWKNLQTSNRFYYFTSVFAGQLVGWSDIECRNINYNERFMNQK